jgi:NifU-like protein
MSRFIVPHPTSQYSKKLIEKILNPKKSGSFSIEEAKSKGVRLEVCESGSLLEGLWIKLFILFNKEDGVIVDVKYQVFGDSSLIGALEGMCETILGMHYERAKRLSADVIDKSLRDKKEVSAFPQETYSRLNMCLEALEIVCERVQDLPLPKGYESPPVPFEMRQALGGGYPGFLSFSKEEKIKVIEDVIERDIRPYIALDGGGISIVSLSDELELKIAYEGNCTSCFSSIGSTLSYIQQVLRVEVHPNLFVTPDASSLFGI